MHAILHLKRRVRKTQSENEGNQVKFDPRIAKKAKKTCFLNVDRTFY